MMPNLGFIFSLYDKVIAKHNLTKWISRKKISTHVAHSMQKGKSPKNDLLWPSNLEGDKLHLNLFKKPHVFKVAHLSST
jgi:hypothetical protein